MNKKGLRAKNMVFFFTRVHVRDPYSMWVPHRVAWNQCRAASNTTSRGPAHLGTSDCASEQGDAFEPACIPSENGSNGSSSENRTEIHDHQKKLRTDGRCGGDVRLGWLPSGDDDLGERG